MSIIGLDFGGQTSLIGCAAKNGIDCMLNDASSRQTAVCVSIQGKQRFLGDAGSTIMRSNLKNTIKSIKYLVGRQYDEPEVQEELSRQAFTSVKLPDGSIGVKVMYNDEEIVLSMTHVYAMVLVNIMATAKKANAGVNVADSVIAVPTWFTSAQRDAIATACKIAELNCLKIMNEGTAIALSYGIYKSARKLFSETEPVHVMFVDIGYQGFTVTITDFVQEKLLIRASQCDRTLGGHTIDQIIVDLMVAAFKKKTGIDVRNNKKAMLKLELAAEKGKKTLSPAGVMESSINVECLAEDMDLTFKLTREDLEAGMAPLMKRMEGPVQRALAEAQLTKTDIAEVELVGGSTRINLIKLTLSQLMGRNADEMNFGLKTTMNADEAICRGAALQSAMESSRIRVQPFAIIDRMPYGIEMNTGGGATASGEGKEDEDGALNSGADVVTLYNRGDEYPKPPRRVTFKGMKASFSFSVAYDSAAGAELPPGTSLSLGKYTVQMPTGYTAPEGYDVRVTFTVNKMGCFVITGAQLMEPLPLEVPATPKEEEAKTGDDAQQKGSAEAEGKTEAADSKAEGKVQGGDVTDLPKPPKRKFKKVDLKVEGSPPFAVGVEDFKRVAELEAQMANEDRIIMETADRRNDLETYTYSMRDRVIADLKDFCTDAERDSLSSQIEAAQEWLYGDGFDATKKDYVERLSALRALSDKFEFRQSEKTKRSACVEQLRRAIDHCKAFANSSDEAYAHITDEDKNTVRDKAGEAQQWLFDGLDKQGGLSDFVDPTLICADIVAKQTALFKATNPIMVKPKPKPPPEEKKNEDEAKDAGESADASKGADKAEGDAKASGDEVPASEAPSEDGKMDTE